MRVTFRVSEDLRARIAAQVREEEKGWDRLSPGDRPTEGAVIRALLEEALTARESARAFNQFGDQYPRRD